MAPGSRPENKLNLNLSGMSAVSDLPSSASSRSPFGASKSTSGNLSGLNGARVGAGSPLHDQGSRLFPKRTRELQGQTGLSPSIWGPPTSGTSTPLYEIPESPSQDGFPDLIPVTETGINSPARRGRAGTLPSRISPVGTINGVSVSHLTSKTSRPTPSTSPFKPPTTQASDSNSHIQPSSSSSAALLSRLRAGSLPQRSSYLGSTAPFGQSVFSPNWNPRDRVSTLTSIKSSDDPSSPTQSNYSKEGLTDTDVRTLDYLGLAETPNQTHTMTYSAIPGSILQPDQTNLMSDLLANLDQRGGNRFRSYSVNAPQKYAAEKGYDGGSGLSNFHSGASTPAALEALADYQAVQEQIRLHNQAVQAYASNATAARPRARTAGIIETPQRTAMRNLMKAPSPVPDMGSSQVTGEDGLFNLSDSLQQMNMGASMTSHQAENYEEMGGQVSRSLWIGSIPVSTTVSSLDAIFSRYGSVESTRVLTHKNCGFVNFENVENAVHARQVLNNKEIFPGAGPVRIGFAKAPTSASMTPAHTTLPPSPTQNSFNKDHLSASSNAIARENPSGHSGSNGVAVLQSSHRSDLQPEILDLVTEFGANENDLNVIAASVRSAFAYQAYENEVSSIPEPSHTRMYDAPRLRDIRKRIDTNACGLQEIEELANNMLPEVAELSSDYLGNTVVQKLFEFCSEQTKEAMLSHIAPHLAEIGIHKNGTWAAQKIIEVSKTEKQIMMVVNSLRPYTVPLFLDQYGNYVLQCCLKFGSPYNDFIFETMLTQMWDIAQGRFGARAMRACLEAHHATKHQQRMLAAAIAMHSVQLATNANGALLLTWFLDTCTFPRRRSVLAPRLVPDLVHLCVHKVAYLTVLKVINQRNEPEARDMILKALFFSAGDETLEQILRDQTSGATLIFKILTTPFFEESMRSEIVHNIAKVLTRIKAQPNQGYKRLMDEVGLSSRPAHAAGGGSQNHAHPANYDRSRPISQSSNNGYAQQQTIQRPYNNGAFMSNMHPQAYENSHSPVRTGSADSFTFPSYGYGQMNPQASFPPMASQHYSPQQIQYQNFLAASQRSNGNYMTGPSFPGYATPPPSAEALRGVPNHGSPVYGSAQLSPIMSPAGYNNQQYTQPSPGSMYGYQPQNFFPQQMQAVHGASRRGRVRPSHSPF